MAQMLEGQTEVTSVCLEGDRYRQASDDHFNELSIIGCRVNNGLPPGASGPLTGPYSSAKRQPVGVSKRMRVFVFNLGFEFS